jgi:hypothetical protein
MRHARLLVVIAAPSLLSACHHPDRTAYDAAMGCLINEVAWHEFVDQTYDPTAMMSEDRRRVELLRARAVRAGQAIGIPAERTYGDTWLEAEKTIRRPKDIQIAVVEQVKHARACLPQPAGSTRFASPNL